MVSTVHCLSSGESQHEMLIVFSKTAARRCHRNFLSCWPVSGVRRCNWSPVHPCPTRKGLLGCAQTAFCHCSRQRLLKFRSEDGFLGRDCHPTDSMVRSTILNTEWQHTWVVSLQTFCETCRYRRCFRSTPPSSCSHAGSVCWVILVNAPMINSISSMASMLISNSILLQRRPRCSYCNSSRPFPGPKAQSHARSFLVMTR